MATKNKLAWISEYSGMAKMLLTILISIVTGVWGVAMLYSKVQNKRASESLTVSRTHVVVVEMKHQLDSLILRMNDFDGQLEAVHENTVLIGNYVGAIHAGIKEDLRTRKDAEFQHYVKITTIIEDGLKKKAQLDSIEAARLLDNIEVNIKVRKIEK